MSDIVCPVCGKNDQACGPPTDPGSITGPVGLVEAEALMEAEHAKHPRRKGEGVQKKRRVVALSDKMLKKRVQTK